MTDAETILNMIETVDPTDTAKLDEIDARVCCYAKGYEFEQMDGDSNLYWAMMPHDRHVCLSTPKYTRSRDALKAIRPEALGLENYVGRGGVTDANAFFYLNHQKVHFRYTGDTEELAELHAIIQAIEYDREQA
jgi:hypothetical protein